MLTLTLWGSGAAVARSTSLGGERVARVAVAADSPDALNVVAADTMLTLCGAGCDFSDLITFRDWVYARIFLGNVTLTLQVADGTYAVRDQFFIVDPKFRHVSIIGNRTDPSRVVLAFQCGGNNLPGFGASKGGQLGFIDGVTIDGIGGHVDRARWNDNSFNGGLSAVGSGSAIHAGGHVVVNDFYYSAIADEGGEIIGDPGLTGNRAGDVNIFARHGGVIHCDGCHANTAAHVFTDEYGARISLGANYMAEAGGHLYVDRSTGTDAEVLGAGARTNGSLWAHGIEITGAAGYGVQVDEGGSAEIGHARVHDNNAGILAASRGWLNIDGVDVYGNRRDGIVADGGAAGGSSPRSAFNGGFGFKSVKGGRIEGYGAVGASTAGKGNNAAGSNGAGLSFVDPGTACASQASTNCEPASFMLLN